MAIVGVMALSRCEFRMPTLMASSIRSRRDADSLYEAVALAVAEFRQGKIITDVPRPMTEFCGTMIRRPIEHRIHFKKVQQWVQPTTKDGPAGIVLRNRLRKLLTGE
jgi:hypothetical protein